MSTRYGTRGRECKNLRKEARKALRKAAAICRFPKFAGLSLTACRVAPTITSLACNEVAERGY